MPVGVAEEDEEGAGGGGDDGSGGAGDFAELRAELAKRGQISETNQKAFMQMLRDLAIQSSVAKQDMSKAIASIEKHAAAAEDSAREERRRAREAMEVRQAELAEMVSAHVAAVQAHHEQEAARSQAILDALGVRGPRARPCAKLSAAGSRGAASPGGSSTPTEDLVDDEVPAECESAPPPQEAPPPTSAAGRLRRLSECTRAAMSGRRRRWITDSSSFFVYFCSR